MSNAFTYIHIHYILNNYNKSRYFLKNDIRQFSYFHTRPTPFPPFLDLSYGPIFFYIKKGFENEVFLEGFRISVYVYSYHKLAVGVEGVAPIAVLQGLQAVAVQQTHAPLLKIIFILKVVFFS